MALEEWRNLLEGSQVPFLTDQKNLEYIKTACGLNARQGWWAMFFCHFNFTLSYRPGSKNTKLDALSRKDESGRKMDNYATPILPASQLIASLTQKREGGYHR